MTKKEKIRWTLIDVVTGLLMVYMCICLMFLEGEVYGEVITPTEHIINIIIGGAMAVGVLLGSSVATSTASGPTAAC